MIDVINILTFIWLLFWAARSFQQLVGGKTNTIFIVIIIHFLFSGIPLLMDILLGQPNYDNMPGFSMAVNDELTSLIYDFYVSVCPLIWLKFGKSKYYNNIVNIKNYGVLKLILYIVVICPVIALLLAPNPQLYLSYALVTLGDQSLDIKLFHQIIAILSTLSVLAVAGIIIITEKFRLYNLSLLFLSIVIDIWIYGKRSIVAFTLVAIGYAFWQKGYLKKGRLFYVTVIGILVMSLFSYYYQAQIRSDYIAFDNYEKEYQNIRIDYGRDSRIKMAIYAELYPDDIQILEYRGQSLVYYFTFFIPRDIWLDKPWPYAVYFTNALFNISSNTFIGWGMTTSLLDEAIANFGWIGMLIGPLIIAIVCRIGDVNKSITVKLFTVLIAPLLLALHLTAYLPLVLIWLFMIVWSHFKIRF